jgi:hypothetical protein
MPSKFAKVQTYKPPVWQDCKRLLLMHVVLLKHHMSLQVLPHVAQSTLRLLRGDAPGVSSPMLYIGMLFATFAWHVEDHYLYSINYQHLGAAKTWYGVPASDADAFEEVARKHVYTEAVAAALAEGKSEAEVAAAVHAALLGKTTMFTPKLLTDNGMPFPLLTGAVNSWILHNTHSHRLVGWP